ncbi:MAG TPA: patatin-like phospholipase family protein [Geminicoccaceae bacterium]
MTEIALALQGGGAHGAFTWGVLERLLDEPDLTINGVSGTSAGAMNACALAQGLARGGAAGAKAELRAFWHGISESGAALANPYTTSPLQAVARSWNLDWSPMALWLDVMAQFVSPYQLNPLDHNPLRALIEERFDFDLLRRDGALRIYVCATNLQTNKMRIFSNADLSCEALLASACLPQLHRAVQVDDGYYWDGGFIGNPVLKPLIRVCGARDILLIQLNPTRREQLPISSRDIMDRLNEVTMNASLMRELDVIHTINRLVRDGQLTNPRYQEVRLHKIADPEVMGALGLRSKNNTAWRFLIYLRDVGRRRASAWLEENRGRIGREATLDLEEFAV